LKSELIVQHSENRSVGPIAFALIVASFFPYITPITTPFSMQPYPLIFGLIYYAYHRLWYFKFSFSLHLPAITLAAASFLMLYDPRLNALRSLFNYASFSLLLYCYVHLLVTYDRLKITHLIGLISVIYVGIGVIQMLIFPSIANCCVGNIGDTEILLSSGRGVSSLTPEPTFYGFFCLAFIIIFKIMNYKKYFYVNLFGLVFLSFSSLAILCFAIYLIITFFVQMSIRNKIYFISISGLIVVVLWTFISQLDLRLTLILNNFIENGFVVASMDESISGRLYHLVQPWQSFIDNWGLPNLFSGLPNGDPRILSGFGSGIYELGVLFLPVLWTIVYICLKYALRNPNDIAVPILLGLIWVNANQLGMSVFIFYLAFIYCQVKMGIKYGS
jgi:hypothetical protein